jgi:hypothetical protein
MVQDIAAPLWKVRSNMDRSRASMLKLIGLGAMLGTLCSARVSLLLDSAEGLLLLMDQASLGYVSFN